MSSTSSDLRRSLTHLIPKGTSTAQQVTVVATILILLQLAFRAWAAFGGWFYVDDFKFLSVSRQPLTVDFLMKPHDNKLMPGGLLIAWLVAKSGAFAWSAAAASLVVMQALASASAWFMLRTLFGARWAVLIPLSLYLFAPITLTAYMWWGAAINLVPMQIAMFLAIAFHVKYVSTDRIRHALLAALSIAFAMFFYQKSLLIYPILTVLTVCYFADGRWYRRPDRVLRRWWRGWVLYAALLVAYLGYTLVKVPSPVSADGTIDYPSIVGAVSFKTFATTAIGGPWRWATAPLPAAQVNPPVLVIVISSLIIAATVAYTVMRRSNTWPAWAMLAGYVVADALLLASGRGSTAGVLAAAEARYVSDAAPIIALAVGLAFLPLVSSRAFGSSPREAPILTAALPVRPAIGLGLVIAVGCAVSSVHYVRLWHDDFAARTFVRNVESAERYTGDVDVLDAEVPAEVLLPGIYPYTLPSKFFNGSPHVRTHTQGTNLHVLDSAGVPRIPIINDGVTTAPPTKESCGTLYSTDASQRDIERPAGLTVPLSGPASNFGTWLALGYLDTQDGEVTITTGDRSTKIPLLRGANTFFMRPGDGFSEVTFSNLSAGSTLCVSSVKVGHLIASEFS